MDRRAFQNAVSKLNDAHPETKDWKITDPLGGQSGFTISVTAHGQTHAGHLIHVAETLNMEQSFAAALEAYYEKHQETKEYWPECVHGHRSQSPQPVHKSDVEHRTVELYCDRCHSLKFLDYLYKATNSQMNDLVALFDSRWVKFDESNKNTYPEDWRYVDVALVSGRRTQTTCKNGLVTSIVPQSMNDPITETKIAYWKYCEEGPSAGNGNTTYTVTVYPTDCSRFELLLDTTWNESSGPQMPDLIMGQLNNLSTSQYQQLKSTTGVEVTLFGWTYEFKTLQADGTCQLVSKATKAPSDFIRRNVLKDLSG